ncbi:hypothetical protein [Opitutus sp. GAS368]|uniref:hypothetical protein n=1 Tax=Opitutus sp. GAS368 TaxID=1882749 RepID=UPI00087C6FC3|nr:hypothetical protein [Opitutus sp. GAS368]SDR82583.1 REP element-mobilizing transposase RayT [Opitutus sp. GAS368]
MDPLSESSHERERVDKSHLPRLAPVAYRGLVPVHWTLTLENRATGWLTPGFHSHFREILLHVCARYGLACPVYVLMPDHMHLLWLGLGPESDQRVAIEFARKHLRPELAPAQWQHQVHDRVLRDNETLSGAFLAVANYILQNPVRAGLVARWQDHPFTGVCVAGYPDLDLRQEDYRGLFWRIHHRLIQPH